MILDYRKYLVRERGTWTALERFCSRIEADAFIRLGAGEVQEFYLLYRRTSSALVVLQESYADTSTIDYLEQLIGRAYAIMYGRGITGKRVRWTGWFLSDFPRTVRRHAAAFGLSLLVMVSGVGFGAFMLEKEPQIKAQILPFGHGAMDPGKRVAEEETGKRQTAGGMKATFSAFLIRNNISVSLRAIAFGLTFGIGTLLLLFTNGIMLGGICLDYLAAGKGLFLTGWLLPHGSVEIPAILLAGQAGFLIAGALLGRGRGTLRMRFMAVGPDIAVIVGGVAVLLVWAGIVEAFFSQYHEPLIPYALKIAFGACELAALTLFLLFCGRNGAHEAQ